jgi:hypothetical protein
MKTFRLGAMLAVLFLGFSKAGAEPYFAAWKGVNCNACHMNQTGGWMRNDFGKNYGSSLETFDWQGLSEASQAIRRNTPTWVASGVDIHESYTATFNQNPALNQSSFYQISPYYPGRSSFSLCVKANEAISAVFTYRLDQGAPKEVYGLISGLPEGLYFKLGRFMMPYGLTLADDYSLVRDILHPAFSFDNPTNDGIEVGIYPGPVFLNAALVNGDNSQLRNPPFFGPVTQTLAEKIVSTKLGVNLSEFTLGASYYGENLDLPYRKMRYGIFGWGRVGPVVLLGEYDQGYDSLMDTTVFPAVPLGVDNNFKAYHVSLESDLGGSVYLRATSELIDHSYKVATVFDGFRHVLSLRCYPVRNLKVQIDGARMDPDAASPYFAAVGGPNYSLTIDAFIFY